MNSDFLCLVITAIGIYGIATNKNIIKSIIFLNIIQTTIILFLLQKFYSVDAEIPILPLKESVFTDPLPQALMITTIVIGAAVTSIALLMSIKVFHYYGTLNWNELLSKDE